MTIKTRKLTSSIWTTATTDLQKLFDESSTKIEILKKLGLKSSSGSNSVLNLRIKKDNILLDKFIENNKKYLLELNKKLIIHNKTAKNDKIKDGIIYLTSPKNFIIRNKILEHKCQECGISEMYNNKPIVLHLDHINGNHHDNTITNLRFLCPNCHSQTSTYCSKKEFLCECGEKKSKRAKLCRSCSDNHYRNQIHHTKNNTAINTIADKHFIPRTRKPKINWPNKETLQVLLDKFPTTIIANSFNVSGKAIEKHCKKLGLSTKPRGYWQKPENDQYRGTNISDYLDITNIKK